MGSMKYMNGVHLSGSKGLRAICLFFFLFFAGVRAADLAIWTEPKPALVFAGENKNVQLYIKNSANAARKIKLETRTYQLGEKATPLGERKKWKEISIDAGQTRIEKFTLTLPVIRAPATFILKFYEEGDVVEAGATPLLVYPEDILSQFSTVGTNRFAGVLR